MDRQRRVKCDETKPVCERCQRLDRLCYGLGFGRIDEEDEEVAEIVVLQKEPELITLRPLPRLSQFESSPCFQDIVELVPRVNATVAAAPYSCTKAVRLSIAEYISALPCRAGSSEALDAAVECVAVMLRNAWIRDSPSVNGDSSLTEGIYVDQLDIATLPKYSKALRLLNRDLQDDQLSSSPETLCAAALLCYLEVRAVQIS